jgi:hypothetical protein
LLAQAAGCWAASGCIQQLGTRLALRLDQICLDVSAMAQLLSFFGGTSSVSFSKRQ